MTDALASWNDTPTRESITRFVESVDAPPEQRIAVFDNDGTLWSEKPMPVELGFILKRLAEMAENDPSLRTRQPWQAAYEKDYEWLGGVITRHYEGDDSDVKILMVGVLAAFADWTVEEYGAAADAYVTDTIHPTLSRAFRQTGYVPMVELLRYLEENGFVTLIASGGNRDFMRGFAQAVYGIPPERVIGSSNHLSYREDDRGSRLVYEAQPDVFDDGPVKPVRIWSRLGRVPLVAGGNSNGDIPMLAFSAGSAERPGLRLLVKHDDSEREFDYTSGAEDALHRADEEGWVVVSIKDDWARVFSDD